MYLCGFQHLEETIVQLLSLITITIHIQIPTDQLRGSHIMQYPWLL